MKGTFKQFTAAGLIAILLAMGFLAEYAHRHGLPCTAESVRSAASGMPGQTGNQPSADKCLICHISQVAAPTPPAFGLEALSLDGVTSLFEVVAPAVTDLHFSFQLRAPPAFTC